MRFYKGFYISYKVSLTAVKRVYDRKPIEVGLKVFLEGGALIVIGSLIGGLHFGEAFQDFISFIFNFKNLDKNRDFYFAWVR